MTITIRHLAIGCCLVVCGVLPATIGRSQRQSSPLLAEPKPYGGSQFLPRLRSDVRLPVALNGFCIVTLRDKQTWLAGSEAYQHVFDGQIYWFSSLRERAKFAATPQRYVPALAGDCVVTLAETGVRRPGQPKHGVLHGHRLFFFASSDEKEAFQSAPQRYDKIDLAHKGHCIVSLTDEQRQIPGMPATTVIVAGMRYQFAGLSEQRAFLSDMKRYGVVRPAPTRKLPSASSNASAPPPSPAPGAMTEDNVASTSGAANSEVAATEVTDHALDGYCPVTIREQGTWVAGKLRFAVEFDGRTYLLAGDAEKQRFHDNPHPYIPALGGDCPVSQVDSNKRVLGTIFHASQFEDRLYLFAAAEQKQLFKASPGTYINADLAAAGNCVVSLVDEQLAVKGRPELLSWDRGKRYYFASPTHQDKFRANIEFYRITDRALGNLQRNPLR